MKYNYVIVGAGLAGVVIANKLANHNENKSILIVEKRNHIAGNCYDFVDENGIIIHKYGPHCFHTNKEKVWKYLSQFTEWLPYEHRVLAKIQNNFVPIPFNLTSVRQCFPLIADDLVNKLIAKCGNNNKIAILELINENDKQLKELADFIYENVFLGYTIKQWGMAPLELDKSVTSRIPVFISEDDRYFQDKYQAIPKYGYTKMIEKMLDKNNIEVLLDTDFFDIKDKLQYTDKLYFSGMIDEFYDYCYGQLPYRSLRFDFETLDKPCQSVVQVNYPNDYDYTRITEFIHFYKNKNYTKSVIAKEYPFQYDHSSKEPPYYPIPQKKNAELYKKYKSINNDIVFVGRLGRYSYYNMDQVVAECLSLFDTNSTI
ncbi:MAG: UDP-galactopyranose mutase [Bacteroidetes bacterium]|nr:UDP-galactopyranose mutase [Bacteroidota bacterium]